MFFIVRRRNNTMLFCLFCFSFFLLSWILSSSYHKFNVAGEHSGVLTGGGEFQASCLVRLLATTPCNMSGKLTGGGVVGLLIHQSVGLSVLLWGVSLLIGQLLVG